MSKQNKPDSSNKTQAAKGSVKAGPAETFHHLSLALVGMTALPPDLVHAHFRRALDNLGPKLIALLEQFAALLKSGRDPVDIIRKDILPDTNLGLTAKTILLLWYTGGIQNAAGDWEWQSADHYYRALVWDAVGAHPPTLSNGYYGHWKYPAER